MVWDKIDGPFAYGFHAEDSSPAIFYMEGYLQRPVWMYQVFSNFIPDIIPPSETWYLPDACVKAIPCPGWEPGLDGNEPNTKPSFMGF